MTPDDFIKAVSKMRDEASDNVKKFRDADNDDEISLLRYYHGQQVALNQVLSWYKNILPPPKTLS